MNHKTNLVGVHRWLFATAALSTCISTVSPALAQNQDQASRPLLEEIVVTATRRAEGSQSVPIALTAVGAKQLQEAGVTNAANLARVAPNLSVQTDVSAGSPRYSLRGVSGNDVTAAASPGVMTYIDDVGQAALYGMGASLFDLQRVEILRGPQGTTFGKNTTGGAVAYFSQTPTDTLEGYLTANAAQGDRPTRLVEGALNLPISDVLALRFSARYDKVEDYLDDLGPNGGERGGGEGWAGRAQLQWTPDDLTTINFTAHGTRRRGDPAPNYGVVNPDPAFLQPGYTTPGLKIGTVSYDGYDTLRDDFNNSGVTLRVERALGSWDLTSISHYRQSSQKITQDLDATADSVPLGWPGDLFFYKDDSDASQYGQEFRLASDATQRISGVLGVYFEHDKLHDKSTEASTLYDTGIPSPFIVDVDGPFGPTPPLDVGFGPGNGFVYDYNSPGDYHYETDTYAVFGSLTFQITDALSLRAGGRYTLEKKKMSGTEYWFLGYATGGVPYDWTEANVLDPRAIADAVAAAPPGTVPILNFAREREDKPWTWDVTLDYKLTDEVMVFGRVARGFHSGGFNQPAGFFVWSPVALNPTANPGCDLSQGQTDCNQNGVADVFDAPPGFNGETLQSYELGVKSTLLNGALRLNATAYHYDYDDQQVTTFPGGLLLTTNAASSTIDGIEVEVVARPTDRLELSAGMSYNDARYKKFVDTFLGADYSDNRLSQAPEWSGNATLSYLFPLTASYGVRALTNWTYRSEIFFTPDNRTTSSGIGQPGLYDDELITGNVRLSFEPESGKGVMVALYGNNITDEHPLTFGFEQAGPMVTGYYAPGRIYGAEVTYRW